MSEQEAVLQLALMLAILLVLPYLRRIARQLGRFLVVKYFALVSGGEDNEKNR
ncbi:hypothetical protein [Pseudoalteromonas sp. CO325X]|uniref:hypothetical protein n=1 Tax=Pseudoalteromonas sp. CO325X TaxID=1777262 RepID=UPI0013EEE918|nr:hypothetical protein [Pseudoalteromonas sp. CO325X]